MEATAHNACAWHVHSTAACLPPLAIPPGRPPKIPTSGPGPLTERMSEKVMLGRSGSRSSSRTSRRVEKGLRTHRNLVSPTCSTSSSRTCRGRHAGSC